MRTHEVTNQPPPRVDVDEYSTHVALVEAVGAFGGQWAHPHLIDVGRLVGSASFQRDAESAHRFPPVLHTHDRYGNRVDDVEFHPGYHRIISAAVEHGAHTSAWAQPRPGANVARAGVFLLFAQVEPGHACPVSMTHAAVPTLRTSPEVAAIWEPGLLSRTYDPVLRDPAGKAGLLLGMAMTEKQGGSDVRSNTTRATPAGSGLVRLAGHKWFCSAPQSDGFLVLAQSDEGLSCYLVPRVLPGGQRNTFVVQRLKDKLGNRSNASSEVEFEGTLATPVGEPGRGVRTIIEMVARTRLDCVYGTAAGMRQSVAEAGWHVRHRRAFGARLADQPAMQAVVADLQLEAEAATWTAARLAAAYDDESDSSVAFRRLATAVSKYWVCKRGPHHAYEALECLGGNGYTETFPLARRYREQPVLAVWEGSGNVIALDVLRAMEREPAALAALDAELELAAGADARFDVHLAATRALAAELAGNDASSAQRVARRLVEHLALALQGSILLRYAPSPVADAFLAARLGPQRGTEYGALPPGVDVAALLSRA